MLREAPHPAQDFITAGNGLQGVELVLYHQDSGVGQRERERERLDNIMLQITMIILKIINKIQTIIIIIQNKIIKLSLYNYI